MNTAKQVPDVPQAEAGSSAEVHPVEALAEEYLRRYRQGEQPSTAEYLQRYPELAEQIQAVFPALIAVERLKPAPTDTSAGAGAAALGPLGRPEQVGAYRLLRVLGRGGMGVVYEAEHEALGRRVAVKVLPVDAARDAKLLARFRREARAAAQLHHSNIVPVFEVGQEGDIVFYAMQYIQGQPVDAVIQELQRLRAASGGASGRNAAAASAAARSLLTGQFEPVRSMHATLDAEPGPGESPPTVGPAADAPAAALSGQSELSMVESNYRLYCRNVARLGLQVAEALAYAHGRGIIHRDIKPSNLLLDTAGIAWVSDFGLVKTQDPALTETGDLVGTLRYMAPERFRGECDARADVYALGLTLYELLVLRPAFDGTDRLHLVEQISHQEPARLRALDPRIPRDLETILMKAIEKDPRRRYPSAGELAEDLRRFLADEPIRARRIGPLERLGRWGRRNPLVAGLSAAVVLVAALGFVGVFGQMQVAQANEYQAKRHAAKAEQKEQEAKKERDEVRALNDKLRRTLYAAHVNLAQHAWEVGGVARVRELLEQHRPKKGETDLRGFEWYYLYRESHVELLTLKKGYTGGSVPGDRSVAFSPDGKRLASSGYSGKGPTMKVWDAQTGQELLSFKHTGSVTSVAFSPDGKRLASAAGDKVKVWDAQTGQKLLTCKGHKGNVSSVAFSPDGKRLASGSSTYEETKKDFVASEVKVWDAQTGKEILSLKGHSVYINSVAFSPDSKHLVSGGRGGIKVWDAQTGRELLTVKVGAHSVAFSPDGKRLASGRTVLDAQTGQQLLTLQGVTSQVNSVAFSPDGKRLATGGGWPNGPDPTVRVWDAQTGQQLFSLKGHTGVIVQSVAFSPDGTRLASSGWDGTVKVWDVTTSQGARAVQTGSAHGVAFSPDGKRLATASGRGVKAWDAQTGKELLTIQGAYVSVVFSPDGKRLAICGDTGMDGKEAAVKACDAQTGQELLTIKGAYVSVVFSPDGKRLAGGGGAGQGKPVPGDVKVWDAQTGQELLSIKGAGPGVAFSPDGKRLATASGREVKVWDAQTGQELLSIKGAGPVVAFSPDGKRLASSPGQFGLSLPGSGEVTVWDAQTGREALTLKGHAQAVSSVAFSPDGKRLASVSFDRTVKVWDAQTGQELLSLTLKGVRFWTGRVTFSPDGNRLASTGPDGTVTIWDATPLPKKP